MAGGFQASSNGTWHYSLAPAQRFNMNRLFVGLSKDVSLPEDGGYLLIDDEVRDIPYSRVFDPLRHHLNPLKDLQYKRARELAEIVYTVYPQGEATLTVRNGKRALLADLMSKSKWDKRRAKRFDRIGGDEEVTKTVQDILMSPVLRSVLCSRTNFSFKGIVQARINRAELGDFDALTLGLILMSYYKGQVVVPDGGFYLREMHVSLVREQRLIVGCNHLNELPAKLRQSVLLFEEKVASGATAQDAETLAMYAHLVPHTIAHKDFMDDAMKR